MVWWTCYIWLCKKLGAVVLSRLFFLGNGYRCQSSREWVQLEKNSMLLDLLAHPTWATNGYLWVLKNLEECNFLRFFSFFFSRGRWRGCNRFGRHTRLQKSMKTELSTGTTSGGCMQKTGAPTSFEGTWAEAADSAAEQDCSVAPTKVLFLEWDVFLCCSRSLKTQLHWPLLGMPQWQTSLAIYSICEYSHRKSEPPAAKTIKKQAGARLIHLSETKTSFIINNDKKTGLTSDAGNYLAVKQSALCTATECNQTCGEGEKEEKGGAGDLERSN